MVSGQSEWHWEEPTLRFQFRLSHYHRKRLDCNSRQFDFWFFFIESVLPCYIVALLHNYRSAHQSSMENQNLYDLDWYVPMFRHCVTATWKFCSIADVIPNKIPTVWMFRRKTRCLHHCWFQISIQLMNSLRTWRNHTSNPQQQLVKNLSIGRHTNESEL